MFSPSVSLLCVLLVSGLTQEQQASRLQGILSIVKQRHDTYNPVHLRYHIGRQASKLYFASISNIDPAGDKRMKTVRNADYRASCEYARNGNMVFDQGEAPFLSNLGDVVSPKRITTCAYDGNLFVTTAHDGARSDERSVYAISREYERSLVDPLSAYNGENMLLALHEYFDKKRGLPGTIMITDQTAGVKNAKVRIRIEAEKADVYDIWLSGEEDGYTVQRLERGNGTLVFHEISGCEYAESEGIRYPKSAVRRNFYHSGKTNGLTTEDRFCVDWISFRSSDTPDSVFTLSIPPGAELIDRDMGNLRITDPAEIQQHIDDAVATVSRRGGSGWKWVYAAGIAVVLLGVVSVILMYIKARKYTDAGHIR